MKLKFLKSSEKKELLSQLGEIYDISDLPYLLLETGKEKIRGFSGTMTKEEIKELSGIANVEIIGAYLFKREGNLRISLDGAHLLKDKIKKGIIEITDEEVETWMKGENLSFDSENEKGIFVVKNGDDLLGCGVSDGKKLINYIPRERRIRRS